MAERYLRVKQVLPILSIGRSKWWQGVKDGIYPQPLKHLGPRTTVWRESEIILLAEGKWQQRNGGHHE